MADDATRIEIASLYGARHQQGFVEITIIPEGRDPYRMLVDVRKAREIAGMLLGAIEAAVSDQAFVAFLRDAGLDEPRVAVALRRLRELRQGSADTVYPT